MSLRTVSAGADIPHSFNVIIEIPAHSPPIKYEVDKDTGILCVDRFMATAMRYPCDYGYIPQTLADDGDPIDVLVISPMPLALGTVICCRAVGVLDMTDESGHDYKIIAVPISKLTPLYQHVTEISDLCPSMMAQIKHFFEHYKDLETGKWVKVSGYQSAAQAQAIIANSLLTEPKA